MNLRARFPDAVNFLQERHRIGKVFDKMPGMDKVKEIILYRLRILVQITYQVNTVEFIIIHSETPFLFVRGATEINTFNIFHHIITCYLFLS